MGGKKISERSIKRKSGPTHPNSRRATQLNRVAHRKDKLRSQKSVRNRASTAKADRLSTMILLLPDDTTHLPDLYSVHDFITNFFLTRFDDEIKALEAERRTGQPPQKKLVDLKDARDREMQLYQEGMEIPDLTDEINVRLLRAWDGDSQALPNFTMVTVSGTYRDQYKLVHSGNHKELIIEREKKEADSKEAQAKLDAAVDGQMDTDK